MTRHYRYDNELKKVVEYFPYKEIKTGLTIIFDIPEHICRDSFPETEKWTGRRSRKALMKKHNCVDFRDITGVGREREKRLSEARKRSGMVNTEVRNISDREVQERREGRRKTHFTGYKLVR